jgi:hypothetical protein
MSHDSAAHAQARSETSASGLHLAEIWGDVVDVHHLGIAIIIGSVISVGTFLIAVQILGSIAPVAAIGRAYAMLAGLGGCVLSGVICARLFAPKREVLETVADPRWRDEAMDELVQETGSVGHAADLSQVTIDEMKELGLYDTFTSYEKQHAEAEA